MSKLKVLQRKKIKCPYCKKEEIIDQDILNVDISFYDNHYYHTECLKKLVDEKLDNPRAKKEKWLPIKNQFEKLHKEGMEKIRDSYYRDAVARLIVNEYGLSIVPNFLYVRLDQVYDGVDKGMTIKIPPKELYAEWKAYLNKLKRIHTKSFFKAKDLHGVSVVFYDLAVLKSHYEDFCRAREKQKKKAETETLNSQGIFKENDIFFDDPEPVNTNDDKIDISKTLSLLLDEDEEEF